VERKLDPIITNRYLGVKFIQLENNISQKLVPRTILGMEVYSGSAETTNQGINLKFKHTALSSLQASNVKSRLLLTNQQNYLPNSDLANRR
jgi:hypothetical protein